MTVGDRIRKERELKGWSQEELAKKMGYKGKATVSKAELHSGEITTAKVQKYADALGVSFEYLMGWTEDDAYTKLLESVKNGEIIRAIPKNDSKKMELISIINTLTDTQIDSLLELAKLHQGYNVLLKTQSQADTDNQ